MEESRAKRIVNELREEMFGPELEAGRQGKQVAEELDSLNPNIEIDAKEFGEHVRNGGWRLGLLVARSVEPQKAGRPSEIAKNLAIKISSRAFARQAGNISDPTVMKYFNAWNLAAADNLVPDSASLSPGQSFAFDDEIHTDKEWKKYFKTPGGDNAKNAFIAMNDKVVAFVEGLDLEAGFSEYDDQLEVSLDTFKENLLRLKGVASAWLIRTDDLARQKSYKDINL